MKSVFAVLSVCMMIISFSTPIWCAEPAFEKAVGKFVAAAAGNDRKALAMSISYPLRRLPPLSIIDNPEQLLEVFDEIFDDKILKALSVSVISSDWSEMGSKGIMFQNGSLWLDDDGKVIAVNHTTEKGMLRRAELIKADKLKLHASLRDFIEPVLEWETARFRIRIDRLSGDKYRYAAWPINSKLSERPDLVLLNGLVVYDGTGGNHYYDFSSGPYRYRCYVNVIGYDDKLPGELQVSKYDRTILSQPVLKIVRNR